MPKKTKKKFRTEKAEVLGEIKETESEQEIKETVVEVNSEPINYDKPSWVAPSVWDKLNQFQKERLINGEPLYKVYA